MFGLWITGSGTPEEKEIRRLLEAQLIPFEGFTAEAPSFEEAEGRDDFLRKAAAAVLQGRPLPLAETLRHLSGREALAGNVLRKYVCLQLSLMPYLRQNANVTQLSGCFLLGENLLIAPLGPDGCVEAQLPPGQWTEMATGEIHTRHLRRIRGLNAMPVLARENSVIPIGVNDRCTIADDADRLTLQWFQPQKEACCMLADGTGYHLFRNGDNFTWSTDTDKPWHLIIRQNNDEILLK